MKKVVIIVIIAIVLVGGIVLAKVGLPSLGLNFLDGERGEVTRGDMKVPITAVGTVESRKLIEIKFKASGVLTKIHTVEGAMVQEGDILAELDPIDEKRNVEAREAAFARVQSLLEKAQINLEDLKVQLPLRTRDAEQRLVDAKANHDNSEYQFNRVKGFYEKGNGSENEFITTRAAFQRATAAKEMAEIALRVAQQNEIVLIRQAEQDVAQAEANVREAQASLDDAKQRLSETTIVAPAAAMVYSILRKEGEMIQSGTMTLGGGTPIMYLADVSSMFVMAQVDEADIGAIREIAPQYARPGKTQLLSEDEYRRRGERIIEAFDESVEHDATTKAAASDNNGGTNGQPSTDKTTSHEVVYDHSKDDGQDAPDAVRTELEGRPVKITVEAYRNEEFRGVIERILPDPIQSGGSVAFRVRIRIFGDDVRKLMGLQADLSFETKSQDNVLLVPNEALRSEGTECYVWVPFREPGAKRDGSKKVWVDIGETDGVNTVIVKGLKEKDEVWIKTPVLTQAERKDQEK
ncbi:MAG: biotin/lipoyl-binding protein [Phycisphaerales bacterium]|nr:biotin/lipoyl-binding protein [Phycisphaerales bacterium]MCB9862689.1 biotin/lipoyl-binding protein [Phycisphaerales bacterium]